MKNKYIDKIKLKNFTWRLNGVPGWHVLVNDRIDMQNDILFSSAKNQITNALTVVLHSIELSFPPSHQRTIGWTLTKRFPQTQFIIATCSPLICQAAVNGSVWRMPQEDEGNEIIGVKGHELNKILYGNLLAAYSTGIFGKDIDRSDHAQKLLSELAELNYKSTYETLSQKDNERREYLSEIFRQDLN